MDTLVYFANKIVYFLIYFGLLTIALSITLKILIKSSHNTKLKELIIGLLNNNSPLNSLSYSFLYLFVVFTIWFILFNEDYSNYIYINLYYH